MKNKFGLSLMMRFQLEVPYSSWTKLVPALKDASASQSQLIAALAQNHIISEWISIFYSKMVFWGNYNLKCFTLKPKQQPNTQIDIE